jgi:hypothetical protein
MKNNEELIVMPAKTGLEIHGAFTEHRITVDGYQVPLLSGNFHDKKLRLVLDNRFGCEINAADAESIVWFIANAMAISGGYSSFGENCQPRNLFTKKLCEITFDTPIVSDVPQ